MGKSRYSQRTETEDTVEKLNKPRSISLSSLYDKITNIEQPKKINVISNSPSLSSMSRPGACVTTLSPAKERISLKINI